MCGITGIWRLNKADEGKAEIERFTDAIKHRGPDGFGYYADQQSLLHLGHRRLSILDLSADGKQPMSFGDRYWITYNGEIFNFIELRDELKQKGYSFKTNTDTEVILAAYHLWGKDCLKKFNGMWAFAIWDIQQQSLFAARDRFGIKPFYYLTLPGRLFAFSSETISFKHLDNYKREFDEFRTVLQLSDSSNLEGVGHTIYKNIYSLMPGHYMHIKNAKPGQQMRWWHTLHNLPKIPKSYAEQIEAFRELLTDAIKLRLRSDVTIATALSGGVDSTAINCLLQNIMRSGSKTTRVPDNWQQAFIATFPDTFIDETAFAKQVVDYTKQKATFIDLDYSRLAQEVISSTIASDSVIGSPLLSSSMIYSAMRKAGVTVSLDGHGVDEMLFGYPWMVRSAATYFSSLDHPYAEELKKIFVDMHFDDQKEKVRSQLVLSNTTNKNIFSALPYGSKVESLLKRVKNEVRGRQDIPGLPQLSDSPYRTDQLTYPEKMLFENFHLNNLPTILRNFDRSSMLNSVEVRMPFMDWRLVSFVFALPTSSKVGGGYSKRILRDAMKGLMPEEIRTRKLKIGLNAPVQDWFNTYLRDHLLEEMRSAQFITCPLINGEKVNKFYFDKIQNRALTYAEALEFWKSYNIYLLYSNN